MITLTIDKDEQKMLTYLISAALGNTLDPGASIAPKVGTGLEYSFLLDLLGRINGMEAKK